MVSNQTIFILVKELIYPKAKTENYIALSAEKTPQNSVTDNVQKHNTIKLISRRMYESKIKITDQPAPPNL